MAKKYLVKAGYDCDDARKTNIDRWFVVQRIYEPHTGPTSDPRYQALLPASSCPFYSRGDEKQSCDDDPDCAKRRITRVLPYSIEVAKRLKAEEESPGLCPESSLVKEIEAAA